jgi:hypothetical protein
MKTIFFAVAFVSMLMSAPAFAQNWQSWVARAGADGNPCTVSLPCSTLQHAIDQTNAGGQVNVADAGQYLNFGPISIDKSISIVNDGSGNAVVSAIRGGGGSLVDISGSASTVTIRGFIFDGFAGVIINYQAATSGSTLIVEKCLIGNSSGLAGGFGLRFQPAASARLVVTDSSFFNNGNPNSGAGIQIFPQSSGSAEVVLERVMVAGNTFGIAADGSQSAAGINMTISDSVVAANSQDGIVATTSAGGSPIGVLVRNTKSVNNGTFGVRAIGAGVTVRMSGSTATGSGTGIAAVSGGTLLTFGNNEIVGNASNGMFSGSVALQ